MGEGFRVNTVAGYEINYSITWRHFVVSLGDQEYGKATTQDEAEALAKRLSKTSKAFPLPVMIARDGGIYHARITSYDPERREAWISIVVGEKEIQREKIRPRDDRWGCVEVTPHNQEVARQYAVLLAARADINKSLSDLQEQLEKPLLDTTLAAHISKSRAKEGND